MTAFRFLAAWLAVPLLGFGAAFHPSVRGAGLGARAGAALGFGAVFLTATAMLLTLGGVAWSVPALAAPPVALSLLLGLLWSRREAALEPVEPPSRAAGWASAAIAGTSLLLLGWTLVTGGATSVDFLYFWGAKAARFADSRSLSPELLRYRFFFHAVPDYPPLVPVVQAWEALAAGKLSWRAAPATSLFWLAAAVPLLYRLLRRRLDADEAAGVVAFWTAALAASLAFSISGGNAEAPLIFFETIAVAALLVEREDDEGRLLPAMMLAGAVLTKVEGTVAAAVIVAGAAARDVLEGRARPGARTARLMAPAAAALAGWFLFQWRMGLPVGYRSHGAGAFALRMGALPTIVGGELKNLSAGTAYVAWVVPLAFLAVSRPSWRRLLPALALTVGLLGFLVFDYMHDAGDPTERIGWTTPRVSQPALSAWILAGGLAAFGAAGRRASTGAPPPE